MQKRRKRRRRRRNQELRLLTCVVAVVVILAVIVGVTGAVKSANEREQQKQEEQARKEQEKKEAAEKEKKKKEAAEKKDDLSEHPESESQDEQDEPFTLADLDNPEGFDTRPTEKGIVLQNTQLDLNGLDTACLDWGQGGDKDQWNRPAGCMQYQEKYGKCNAHFIVDEPEKKVIYLTIDEGYEYGCSPRILDTLKEKNVHAVFFVTKSFASQNPDLVQRMIDEGHEVGNHSVTHPAAGLPSQTIEQQTEEVTGNHSYIKEQFDYDMHLFRYPAGKFSEQSAALLNNLNYKSIFWSFAYLDYDVNNQPDPGESLQKLMDCLHPGAIYLLHAESETNTQILGDFIDQTRAQGYEFKLFQ
ncbi:delta-lactam-biosynthetic de-N-acetylase [Eubacterium sp. 14-2]|uniref:delta-lactam-biosynthetic de-N-acetylase n=1 Tax=Eubacterium sp. 14-2 TaxID=1235790 RepID=UPI00033E6AD7|nr:polysaccharide deacetylase family protein [Eubacterium sp. 14-2]EOT21680.1 delta-lactam-biosynthetic de-N-acetylase [Eubacterium sp. 14-2]